MLTLVLHAKDAIRYDILRSRQSVTLCISLYYSWQVAMGLEQGTMVEQAAGMMLKTLY